MSRQSQIGLPSLLLAAVAALLVALFVSTSNASATCNPNGGNSGPDNCIGGAGADTFNTDGGNDYAQGNGGGDTLVMGDDGDHAHGNEGPDEIDGLGGWDTNGGNCEPGLDSGLDGGDGIDVIDGGDGSDYVAGAANSFSGGDTLKGGQDSDCIDAVDNYDSCQPDDVNGGLGADVCLVDRSNNGTLGDSWQGCEAVTTYNFSTGCA